MIRSKKKKILIGSVLSIVMILMVWVAAAIFSGETEKPIKEPAKKIAQNSSTSVPEPEEKLPEPKKKTIKKSVQTEPEEKAEVVENEKIVISDEVKEKLIDLMIEPVKTVPVDRESEMEELKRFRNFVAASMDLTKAEKYVNNEFSRVNYLQEVTEGDVVRTLGEEMDREGQLYGDLATSSSNEPVKLHYHEGPNYMEFEREKQEVAISNPVSEEKAIEMVSEYVENMQLVNETGNDRVRSMDVDRTNIAEEIAGSEGQEQHFTVQQSVNLRREYENIPVINSSIRVSFNPETQEVLQLAKRYWPPLAEKKEVTVKKESSANEARQLANKAQNEVINTIQNKNTLAFQTANVTDVNKAYFQTQEGLKPVLYFNVNYKYTSEHNKSEFQPGVVLISQSE